MKKSKTYIRRPQIKNIYKTDTTKCENYDSKYNFKIFKNQKSNSKKFPKYQKHIKGGLKSKSFIKQTPPKLGIHIQNTMSKLSKTKNQTQKRLPKVPKNQKHI